MIKRYSTFTARYISTCLKISYVATIGMLSATSRKKFYELAAMLGWKDGLSQDIEDDRVIIPTVMARDILPSPRPVVIYEQDAEQGNVSGYEMLLLAQLVAHRTPDKIFEIGTYDGRSSLNMIANAKKTSVLYTLDLPRAGMANTAFALEQGDSSYVAKEASGVRFHNSQYSGQIIQLYGDSARYNYAEFKGQVDFVFVDGSHAYEYVINDTKVALDMIKISGGTIVWHDYGSPWWKGLTQAMNELYDNCPEMKRAVHIRDTTLVVLRM